MRRIRNTFEELNPSRQWKFESSYLNHIVKISTESSFFLFSSDRHFRYIDCFNGSAVAQW